MKKWFFFALCCLFFAGCESTRYIRSETIRPGMSLQYLFDFANSVPNCKLQYGRLAETEDCIVYQMYFIDGSVVRPYRCTFSNGPTPASQILKSIEFDQAQNVREADAIMRAAQQQRGAMQNIFAPPGQRLR